jgi:hypothetical protein
MPATSRLYLQNRTDNLRAGNLCETYVPYDPIVVKKGEERRKK